MIIRFKSASLVSASVMDISSNYENSAEFLAFYALFNLYLYTMAFMYSPSPHAIRGEFCQLVLIHLFYQNDAKYDARMAWNEKGPSSITIFRNIYSNITTLSDKISADKTAENPTDFTEPRSNMFSQSPGLIGFSQSPGLICSHGAQG